MARIRNFDPSSPERIENLSPRARLPVLLLPLSPCESADGSQPRESLGSLRARGLAAARPVD